MRFITGGRLTPRRTVEDEVLPRFLDSSRRHEGLGLWAAEAKDTGRFLGWFELRPRQYARPEEVELGYRLRRSVWGKGYATECACALVDRAPSTRVARPPSRAASTGTWSTPWPGRSGSGGRPEPPTAERGRSGGDLLGVRRGPPACEGGVG